MSSFYALTQFPLTYHVLYETDAVCKMRLLRASAGVLWYDKELNLDLNDYFSLNDLGSSELELMVKDCSVCNLHFTNLGKTGPWTGSGPGSMEIKWGGQIKAFKKTNSYAGVTYG